MRTVTSRERRLIGLGLIAAVAIAAYLYVLEPLLTRQREWSEMIPAREALLERRRLLIAQRPRIAAELEAITRQLEDESAHFLPGPTAPLAASALQKLVKGLATEANVDVRSERVLAPVALASLHEVPIELTVAGTIRQTAGLLQRIEQADQLLTVKDLKLRVTSVGQPRELLATVVIAGYFLPGVMPSERIAEPKGPEATSAPSPSPPSLLAY
jgi:hypothetical protein